MRIATTVLLVAAGLAAQPPRPEGGFMRFHPVLKGLDANQDGVISAAELGRAPQVLANLDQNKDGLLSVDEMRPAFGPGGPGGGPGRGRGPGGPNGPGGPDDGKLADQLMQFDKNRDGVLTANEVPDRMQGLFARADSNQDGRLTREELAARAQAAPARGAGGDHDHERGGPRGFPGGPPRDPIMNALDANQDGSLDARERQGAAKALAALDRDHDGQLTEDEVRPAMPFGRRGPRHEEERH